MKTKKLSIVNLLLLGNNKLSTQEKTEKFKVKGNCGMCKNTIEKAANAVDGVSKANWDKETKMIEVSFDDTKTDLHKIHQAIANSGYDTEMHKATEEVYNQLHSCCKYDREE